MVIDYLVVEDHPITAEGIRQQVLATGDVTVMTANSLAEAEAALREHTPGTIVIDMSLPDGDGIEFYRRVSDHAPDLRGILLSGMLSDADIQRAIAGGFSAILTKESATDLIAEALARVADGDTFYSPDVAPVVESLSGGDLFTARMIEVLAMLQDGLSNKQIATALDVTEATVSFHVSQIKARLGARTNRQILTQARKLGISVGSKPSG